MGVLGVGSRDLIASESVSGLPPPALYPVAGCGLDLTGQLPEGSQRTEGESKLQLTQTGQSFKSNFLCPSMD